MAFKINDIVTWVGKIDWELRSFHGKEYSTYKGSSYNSYLIKDEKCTYRYCLATICKGVCF